MAPNAHGNAGFGLTPRSAKDGTEREATPQGCAPRTAQAMDGLGTKAAACHGWHRLRTARQGGASGPAHSVVAPVPVTGTGAFSLIRHIL